MIEVRSRHYLSRGPLRLGMGPEPSKMHLTGHGRTWYSSYFRTLPRHTLTDADHYKRSQSTPHAYHQSREQIQLALGPSRLKYGSQTVENTPKRAMGARGTLATTRPSPDTRWPTPTTINGPNRLPMHTIKAENRYNWPWDPPG